MSILTQTLVWLTNLEERTLDVTTPRAMSMPSPTVRFVYQCAQAPGLPDCIFFKPKIQDWVYLVAILEYVTTIWYVSWPLGIFCGHLVKFSPFRCFVPRKTWQPWQAHVLVFLPATVLGDGIANLGLLCRSRVTSLNHFLLFSVKKSSG
jgi:hypothetical protein